MYLLQVIPSRGPTSPASRPVKAMGPTPQRVPRLVGILDLLVCHVNSVCAVQHELHELVEAHVRTDAIPSQNIDNLCTVQNAQRGSKIL